MNSLCNFPEFNFSFALPAFPGFNFSLDLSFAFPFPFPFPCPLD